MYHNLDTTIFLTHAASRAVMFVPKVVLILATMLVLLCKLEELRSIPSTITGLFGLHYGIRCLLSLLF